MGAEPQHRLRFRGSAGDVEGLSGPRLVVLISDGMSTCGDPCPVAEQIKSQLGIDFQTVAIGFQAPESAERVLGLKSCQRTLLSRQTGFRLGERGIATRSASRPFSGLSTEATEGLTG